MKELKKFIEVEALKSMSYEQINELINKVNDENKELKRLGKSVTDDFYEYGTVYGGCLNSLRKLCKDSV